MPTNPPDINIMHGDVMKGTPDPAGLQTNAVQQFNSKDGLNYTVKVFDLHNTLVAELPVTPRLPGKLPGSSLKPAKYPATYHYFVYSTGSTHGAQHVIIISNARAVKKRKHKKVTRKHRPKGQRKGKKGQGNKK
jgi:hypothetical protein